MPEPYLSDDDLAGRGHVGVEIPRRVVEHQVAVLVCLPALDEREVASQRLLEQVLLAIEDSNLPRLAVRDYCLALVAEPRGDHARLQKRACARGRVEGWDASAASPESLDEVALGCEVELKFPVEVLLLENAVHADVRSEDLSHLVVLQEQREAVLVAAALVRDESEVLGAPLGRGLD